MARPDLTVVIAVPPTPKAIEELREGRLAGEPLAGLVDVGRAY